MGIVPLGLIVVVVTFDALIAVVVEFDGVLTFVAGIGAGMEPFPKRNRF